MEQAKHTPGPWRLSNELDTQVEAVASGNFIASCDGGGEDGEYETDLANARLCAAAPDLLAAAKRALNVLKACGYTTGGTKRPTVLDALSAAIHRATGE
jgi:hypothetical protein